MKDNVNLNNGEKFSIEVRKNNILIEKSENNKKYLIKNHYANEVEYSYAFYKED